MKKYRLSIALIGIAIIISIVTYSSLPAEIPTHWGVNGEPDDFSSKLFGVSIGPTIMTFIFLLLIFLPKLDPKKENYTKFSRPYFIISHTLLIFLLLLHIVTIAYGLGYHLPIDRIVVAGLGIIFIVIGNYLPKVKHNYFIGVRTPWTLSSEEVWKKTHRLSGKVFVVVGLVITITSFIFKGVILFGTVITSVVVILLFSTLSSFYFFKNLN